MRNVSNAFKEVIKNGGPFYAYAEFVLADGTELTMTSQNDFYVDGNSYGQSGSGGFPIGDAISKTIDIGIDNCGDRYSQYDFYKAKITLYTEADLPDGTTERLQEGIFTVVDSVTPGEIIEITAYDNMYKADVDFESELKYPATLLSILQEVCKKCDLSLKTPRFKNYTMGIRTPPENVTARQLIGYISQIAGGNALIDEYGYLVIKEYDLSTINELNLISGGNLTDNISDYISGGQLGETVEDYIDGGIFGGISAHILSEFTTDPDISTDDITITGVKLTLDTDNSEEKILLYGTDDYAIEIDNPLATGNEKMILKSIGDSIIGITVRPFSGTFLPNPTIEFMDDVFVIDRKDNIYQSIVTSNTFTYLGNSNISNDTESPERNGMSYQNNATNVYRKVKNDINRERTEWEKAVDNLSTELQNASGLYQTNVVQPDGSTIYYLHDKKTLEESEVIIKVTSQAIGISTDGGQTYPTGITVDGEAIVSILQAVGINADWITTGTLTLGGVDNEHGTLNILDSNNKQIGKWDNNGILVEQGTINTVSSDSTTKASMNGGRIKMTHSNTDVGYIGASKWSGLDNYGINFDLDYAGSYLSWASKDSTDQSLYYIKMMYAHKTFADYQKDTLYFGCPIDFQNKRLYNLNIDSASVTTLKVYTSCDIWATMDMHNQTIQNVALNSVNITSLKSINGYSTWSGTIPCMVYDSAKKEYYGSIIVKDGIITGASNP